MTIPLSRPCFGRAEEKAVLKVLRSGWVSQGPQVLAFEEQLAHFLGCRQVCAVNSGTSALLLALRSLDLGPADAVIVPAFTCAATALPVLETGANLIFADIELTSFNVRWESIARVLTPQVKVVMVAHMFGQVAEVDRIARECANRGIVLIEDTALAFGAALHNQCAGTFGTLGCFSFHPRKIITTGEGGAICTDQSTYAQRIMAARNYGSAHTAWTRFLTGDGSPRGFERRAFNMKLTDLQAALGLVQLKRLDALLARRRAIARDYIEALTGFKNLVPPALLPDRQHVYQALVCMWRPDHWLDQPSQREQIAAQVKQFKTLLKAKGIAVADAAQFLPELPIFHRRPMWNELPLAYCASQTAFALPMYPSMTKTELNRILRSIKTVLNSW